MKRPDDIGEAAAPAAKKCSMPREAVAEVSRTLQSGGVEKAADDSFTLASWNVNRIPFARDGQDYRADRNACMSEILQQFDVTAMSERFLSLPKLKGHGFTSDNISRDRINWLGMNSKHHGLTLSSSIPMTIAAEDHYQICAPNRADCRVRKGFLISEVATPLGSVVIATTHLDAGRDPRDRAARAQQLQELSEALQPYRTRPLILMGDLNLTTGDAQDIPLYQRFMQEQGLDTQLRQSGKGHDVLATRGVDVLHAVEYSNDSLTDHPLLAARVRITPPLSSPTIMAVGGR